MHFQIRALQRWPPLMASLFLICSSARIRRIASMRVITGTEDLLSELEANATIRQSVWPWNNSSRSRPDCCNIAVKDFLDETFKTLKYAVAFGDHNGPCCVIEHGHKRDETVRVFSSGKWIWAYVMGAIIDNGHYLDAKDAPIGLDTRVGDLLGWWTTDPTHAHRDATIRHFLSQTAGADTFGRGWKGLGKCDERHVIECAKVAHNEAFYRQVPLGTEFRYAETNWHILGAIALTVTGFDSVQEVFQHFLGRQLGMSKSDFSWGFALPKANDPGACLRTTLGDYTKFLTFVMNKGVNEKGQRVVSKDFVNAAESIQTAGTIAGATETMKTPERMPTDMPAITLPLEEGHRWHYGLGNWAVCDDKDCNPALHHNSLGLGGTFPWIDRSEGRVSVPHWGVLLRTDTPDMMNLAADPRLIHSYQLTHYVSAAMMQRKKRV